MKSIVSIRFLILTLVLASAAPIASAEDSMGVSSMPPSTTPVPSATPSTATVPSGALVMPSDNAPAASGSTSSTTTTSVEGPSSGAVGAATTPDPATMAMDNKITSDAQSAIAANSELVGTNITVTSSNGMVTLTGTVNTPIQLETVTKLVGSMAGVKNVKSTIVVNSPTASSNVSPSGALAN